MEKDKERDNKKTLILSILGILVLVIAVVGVSFAMYSFTGTGTKNNRIVTGTATLDFDDDSTSEIALDDSYPMSDEKGLTDGANSTFAVSLNSDNDYAMNVNYEVGITSIEEGTTLTSDYIKITVKKGTQTLVDAKTISELQSSVGFADSLLDSYVLVSGTLAGIPNDVSVSDTYTVYAWVSDSYDLAVDKANSTSPEVEGGTLDNQSNTLHQKATKADTYKFKLTISAIQVTEPSA